MNALTTYRIVQFGSLRAGWALEVDGIIRARYPSPIYLATHLEARLKGAEAREPALIAKAVSARPWPTYEERMAQFTVTGTWQLAQDSLATKA